MIIRVKVEKNKKKFIGNYKENCKFHLFNEYFINFNVQNLSTDLFQIDNRKYRKTTIHIIQFYRNILLLNLTIQLLIITLFLSHTPNVKYNNIQACLQ